MTQEEFEWMLEMVAKQQDAARVTTALVSKFSAYFLFIIFRNTSLSDGRVLCYNHSSQSCPLKRG